MAALSDFLEVEIRRALFRTNTITVRDNLTAYALGVRVQLGTADLSIYEVITAGTSAAAPPVFNTTLGDTTTDGTVTWLTLKAGMPKRPIFVALFTAAPSDSGGGTEVSGGSYARVAVGPADGSWSAASSTDGLTDNVADVTFPAPTANWGVVGWVGIFDRLTAGNLLFHGALTTPKTVNSGDQAPKFLVGNLDITLA